MLKESRINVYGYWTLRVPNFMCQGVYLIYITNHLAQTSTLAGGDFIKGDGTGSFSIYGDKFPVSLQLFRIRVTALDNAYYRTRTSKKNIRDQDCCLWYAQTSITLYSVLTQDLLVSQLLGELGTKHERLPGTVYSFLA